MGEEMEIRASKRVVVVVVVVLEEEGWGKVHYRLEKLLMLIH